MSEHELTQDAEYLLCVLYDAYRTRRKNGKSIYDAVMFGNAESIQQAFCPELSTADISAAASWLEQRDMLACEFGDNELNGCDLLAPGIAYMEQRFGRKFDQLVERISALRSAILG